jgi:uncharacterized HAD superfamily protein
VSHPFGSLLHVLIGLDLDGVLADLGPGVAARIEERFGIATHPSTWSHYDLRHLRLGVPHDRFVAFLDDVFDDPRLYVGAPLQAGAASGIACLIDAGWRAVGITARPSHLGDVTRAWLHDHGLPLQQVFHTRLGGKARLAAELGVLATIEDNPVEAELLGAVCDSWLLDQPYNRAHRPVDCRRIASWDDAIGRLCQLRLFA